MKDSWNRYYFRHLELFDSCLIRNETQASFLNFLDSDKAMDNVVLDADVETQLVSIHMCETTICANFLLKVAKLGRQNPTF